MSNLTPLMEQYHRLKNNHKDSILFFRLGDFYEMFYDDAKTAAKVLRLTLTSRQDAPMCGIPHHSAKFYIARLIKEGFSVAISEQMEDPSKVKGLVKREVVRVITSGTLTDENLLEAKTNNFLCAIYRNNSDFAAGFADISTGDFFYQFIKDDPHGRKLSLQLVKFSPSEILLSVTEKDNPDLLKNINAKKTVVKFVEEINFSVEMNKDKISGFEYESSEDDLAMAPCVAIISYIEKTQPETLVNIKKISKISCNDFLALDELAVKNLELVEGLASGTRSGSLFGTIDRTVTPMGGRLLRKSLLEPLLDIQEISDRHDAVEFFIRNGLLRIETRNILNSCQDIERILARISAQTANARDMSALKKSLMTIPAIKIKIQEALKSPNILGEPKIIKNNFLNLKPLDSVVELIEKAIVPEPPQTIKDGGIIKDGYNKDLDELRFMSRNAREWILQFEAEEKQRTQIQSLKVRYNSVFGYYIEVTKANLDKVPQDYIRKQTIANGERFITETLKQKESMILGAEEKISALEYGIFLNIRGIILQNISDIQVNAKAIASIDMCSALAETAVANNYVRPVFNNENKIDIADGRHPVVETMLDGKFISNDLLFDDTKKIAVITGPNMSGKSTYLRQAALITIMAQMGSFVPAREAKLCIIDSIFTRIGASDRLTRGESTFMVEMKELAGILANASPRSLILLDEVGRGTSTFDGISIAWATIEYLKPLGSFVLFATHYFELTELANIHEKIFNLNVSVKEWKGEVLFLHKIVDGSADKSYGIHVAKIAGIPQKVIGRAKVLLEFFENNSARSNQSQPELFDLKKEAIPQQSPILEELEVINTDDLSPKAALEKIYEWKKKLNTGE